MIKRILPEELKLGMYIDSAVFEAGEKADFIDSFLVDSVEKLKKLQEKGVLKYLYIDTDKSIEIKEEEKPQPEEIIKQEIEKVEEVKPQEPEKIKEPLIEKVEEVKPQEPEEIINPVPFKEELKVAVEVKKQAHNIVKSYMEDARAGKSLDSEKIKNQASDMVDSILRNDNALVSLTRIKSFDEYTFTHSVNVAVLVTSFARRLGFNRGRLERLAVGGLLHDLGKVKIPDEILNKPGPFTIEERKMVQNHPTFSAEMLEKTEDITEDSIRLAFEHHERLDGKGYPRGLSEDGLHIDSNIISICDVYDALTSARVYKPGFPLPKALQIMIEKAGTEFKRNLVEMFIKIVGAYPVGSLVELNTGELTIVSELNEKDIFKPWVIIITDWKKKFVKTPETICLGTVSAGGREIIKYHDPHILGINPNNYLVEYK
jgi:putative nucleotidyltransferase with HDIG domain